MSKHPFEISEQIDIEATPEQVWEAIATGPGVDSWFMGHSEIEPHEGGKNTMTLLGQTSESTTTAWEPGRRFAYRSAENPEDGTFMAFEMLIEGRAGGSTTLRFVHNGFLGDDWEEHYDALRKGDPMYLKKLATYLKHFPGRTATYTMFLVAPAPVIDSTKVWSAFTEALGLTGPITEGERVRLTVPGIAPVDGVVAFVLDGVYAGVRTKDGIYALMHGFKDGVVAEYHAFATTDGTATERAWNAWLAGIAS